MPSIDVLFKDGADAHHADKQLVTAKPGGSLWTLAELAGNGSVTLDVDQATFNDVFTNLDSYFINDKANPTALIKV